MSVAHDGSTHPLNPFEQNLDAFLGPMPSTVAPRSRPTIASAIRTLVLVGNLPVWSGLWLAQYAEREARERGAVCMLRIDRDAVQIELFVAHGNRPTIRPQATLAEALRAIAPVVAGWLVVPPGGDTDEIPSETGEVVILTGADEPAIVRAYGLIKKCMEGVERRDVERVGPRTPPRISVTVLGATEAELAATREKLDKTSRTFLKVDLPVRGGLQHVAPTESAFRGTFNAHAPLVADLFAMIRTAEAAASLDAGDAVAAPAARGGSARAERFASRPERVAPRRTFLDPTLHHAGPIPFSRSGALGPTEGVKSVAAVPPQPATAAPVLAASAAPPATDSHSSRGARAAVAPANAMPASQMPKSAVAPKAAALPPELTAPTRARSIAQELPAQLVPELAGLEPLPIRAPRDKSIELAIDNEGRLHIVGRATDAAAILRVRGWAREHGELLVMADARIAHAEPVIDLVVSDLRDARAIDGATVHVLTLVEIAGRRGYLAQIAPP